MKKLLLLLFSVMTLTPILSNAQCTVDAGMDQVTICRMYTYGATPVSATISPGATLNWTTSGTGTFSIPTSPTASYIPSRTDSINGSIILTATVIDGACTNSDQMTLTITPYPTINAGIDQSACQGWTGSLSASITGNSTLNWTTSGTGTFSSPSSPTATYTPSRADSIAGAVTIIASATSGSCFVSDYITATIMPKINAGAGVDQSVCQGSIVSLSASKSNNATIKWTTSGTGTFTSASSPTTVYTPSPLDITNGSMILTATASLGTCTASDQMIVTAIPSITINAGIDKTTTCGSGYAVSLAATTSNLANINWTSSSNGTFTPPNSLITSYRPNKTDTINGSVTLTAAASVGTCTASDQMIITIALSSKIYSGVDQTICGSSANLSATYSGSPTLNWTSISGTGIFLAPTSPTAIYLPSPADVMNGFVIITATVSGGLCAAASDNVRITILNEGSLQAGPDQYTTSSFVNLSGTATGISSTEWTTNGTGTFSNATSLSTTYMPSAADIANGIVKIQLNSISNESCTANPDEMLLSIGATYSISGTITAATNPLDKGVVLLFKQVSTGLRFITSDTINITDAGMYNFNNIPAGTYVLQATPTTGSSALNSVLPTYTGGTQTWNSAQTITVANNTTTNILLTPYVSTNPTWNTGTDIITGIITLSADAAANARTAINDIVAAFVTVYLIDLNEGKIAYTQSDSNGRYKFEDVKAGTYYVVTDFVSTELESATTSIPVSVDGLSSTIENMPLSLKERISVTTGIVNTTKSTKLTAYPNPASNSISIDLFNVAGTGEIKILNETGAIKMQQQVDLSATKLTLQIEALPAGIYLVQLITNNEVFTSKMVKY